MIKRVKIKNFKQFKEETFELDDSVVLAGPNNAGKSTLLQAIATWSLTFSKWKSHDGGKKRKNRMNLTRGEFMSLPLQHFNLLWIDTSTALRKDEGGGRGAQDPRLIHITLEGTKADNPNQTWKHTMELRYTNPDMILIKEITYGGERPPEVDSMKVVHIPSFSGIDVLEEVRTKEVQDWLIGQGKPGDIIRNLLLDVAANTTAWKQLGKDIKDLFGYTLRKPDYIGRPHILCEYIEQTSHLKGRPPRLDIASAGSGFLQTLLMLAFIYARDATILLVDEPDAHLHINLQKQIYDRLKEKAAEKKRQLVIATHSEIIIDKTDYERIISFYQKPHRLGHEVERDGMREALKMLSNVDILQAERGRVLYTEGDSDLNILSAWAEKLNHWLQWWLSSREAFHYPIKGSYAGFARHHFFALRATNHRMVGALLLDSDNRNLEEQETSKEKPAILKWRRYEIENYLVHPEAIKRFIQSHLEQNQNFLLFEKPKAEEAVSRMYRELPAVVTDAPLGEHGFLNNSGMSKEVLPKILSEYIPKSEYYKIAQVMRPEEIHPEVTEKLDALAVALKIPEGTYTSQEPAPPLTE